MQAKFAKGKHSLLSYGQANILLTCTIRWKGLPKPSGVNSGKTEADYFFCCLRDIIRNEANFDTLLDRVPQSVFSIIIVAVPGLPYTANTNDVFGLRIKRENPLSEAVMPNCGISERNGFQCMSVTDKTNLLVHLAENFLQALIVQFEDIFSD